MYMPLIHLKLALNLRPLILFKQHIAVGVRVEHDPIERVELARAIKHILVDAAIMATQTRVELPVGELPRIDEANSMRPNLLQQLHNRGPR